MAAGDLYQCPVCKHRFSPSDFVATGGRCRKCDAELVKFVPAPPVRKETEEDKKLIEEFLKKKDEPKPQPPVYQDKDFRIEPDTNSKRNIVVAEVLLPSQNEMDSTAVMQFVSALPENISMEYYGHGPKRYMLLRGEKTDIKYVAAKIAVLYPAASVNILSFDPTIEMKSAAHKIVSTYGFSGEDYLPIKTYEKYSDGDPVHTILAGLLDLGKEDSLWIQIQFLAREKPEWHERILQRIKSEEQKGWVTNPKNEGIGDSIGASTPTAVYPTVNLKKAFFTTLIPILWLFTFVAFMFRMYGIAVLFFALALITTIIRVNLPKEKTDAWYTTDLETVKMKATSQQEFNKVVIRVVAASDNTDSASEMLKRIRLIFNQYSLAGGNSLILKSQLDDVLFSPKLTTDEDNPLVMWMSDAELGGLWHIPYNSDSVSPGLIPVRGIEMRCPDVDDVAGFYQIGSFTQPNGESQPVNLNQKMLKHNMFLIGKPGTGKTSMMEHIAMAAIDGGAEDSAIIVIDPHGDMFMRLAGCIPPERYDDVVLLDFGDPKYVVPYNPLDVHTSKLSIEQSTQLIVDIGKALWSTSWGPRMQIPLQRAVSAISAHNKSAPENARADGLSLLGVFLNSGPKGRTQYLSEIGDERIKTTLERYFNDDFNSYGSYMREQIIMPVLSKSYRFEESPMLEFFSAPESILNPSDIIKNKKILLVNTRMSQFGSELSNFIGSFVINIVLKEISRQGEDSFENRNPVLLIIDEFQTYSGVPWQELLAQLRKWGGRTVLGTQSFASMVSEDTKELPGIIMSGVYSLIAFAVNGEDAEYLSKNELSAKFGGPSRDTLVSLDPYSCYARFMRQDGKLSRPFFFRTASPVKPDETNFNEVMARRDIYAITKEQATANALGYLQKINDYSFISSGSEAGKNKGNNKGPTSDPDKIDYNKNNDVKDEEKENKTVSPHEVIAGKDETENVEQTGEDMFAGYT